jgi:hypothetical protein
MEPITSELCAGDLLRNPDPQVPGISQKLCSYTKATSKFKPGDFHKSAKCVYAKSDGDGLSKFGYTMKLDKRMDLDESYSNDNITPVFDLDLMSKQDMDLFANSFSTMINAAIKCNDISVVSDVFKEYLALVFQEGGHRLGNHIRVFFMQLIEHFVKSEHFKATGQKLEDYFECLAYPEEMFEAMSVYTDSQLKILQVAIEQVIDVPTVREHITENNLERNATISSMLSWAPFISATPQYTGGKPMTPFDGPLDEMESHIAKIAMEHSDNKGQAPFIFSKKAIHQYATGSSKFDNLIKCFAEKALRSGEPYRDGSKFTQEELKPSRVNAPKVVSVWIEFS